MMLESRETFPTSVTPTLPTKTSDIKKSDLNAIIDKRYYINMQSPSSGQKRQT